MSRKKTKLNREKGSILLLVLVVVAAITAIATGLTFRTRVEINLAKTYSQRAYVYYLAMGGVEAAKARLSEKPITAANIAGVCPFSSEAGAEGLFEAFGESLGEKPVIFYGITDELGYFNVNKSDPAAWANLGLSERDIPACIIDWADEDDEASSGGVETDYYKSLATPYTAKNNPCKTLKELLFVKNVTPQIYAGEDLNRNSKSDENESDGSLTRPADNGDGKLDCGLADLFTVCGNGKLNINTCGEKIMAALPGMDESAAAAVCSYRAGPDGRAQTDDDIAIEAAKGIDDIEGISDTQKDLLGQYCCFSSGYFRIFSYAKIQNGIDCALMATAAADTNDVKLISLEVLP